MLLRAHSPEPLGSPVVVVETASEESESDRQSSENPAFEEPAEAAAAAAAGLHPPVHMTAAVFCGFDEWSAESGSSAATSIDESYSNSYSAKNDNTISINAAAGNQLANPLHQLGWGGGSLAVELELLSPAQRAAAAPVVGVEAMELGGGGVQQPTGSGGWAVGGRRSAGCGRPAGGGGGGGGGGGMGLGELGLVADISVHIQMELCQGTLAQLIRRGGWQSPGPTDYVATPVPREQLFGLFVQLLAAVEYVHCAGCVHRDIKPANVFLTTAGEPETGVLGPHHASSAGSAPLFGEGVELVVKLGDFGLAAAAAGVVAAGVTAATTSRVDEDFGDSTSSGGGRDASGGSGSSVLGSESSWSADGGGGGGGGVGTALYSSPQQDLAAGGIDGGEATAADDVYSLGATMLEVFSGFETAMQRAAALGGLKWAEVGGSRPAEGGGGWQGRLPAEFVGAEPELAALIGAMTAPRRADRPAVAAIRLELEKIQVRCCLCPGVSTAVVARHCLCLAFPLPSWLRHCLLSHSGSRR